MQALYRDPNITSLSRMPARARRTEDITLLTLNEGWLFRLFDKPEDCGEFYLPETDESSYRPITVPGNWQLQGFEPPIYTNTLYPWPKDAEGGLENDAEAWKLPDFNPTGCYRVRFTMPNVEPGTRCTVRFEGVETAYELYVNGTFVGYAEDSKLASEFDLTSLLVPGENLMALKVITYPTSVYLEDQDYWYLQGIFRPVYILAEPEARIDDYKIEAVPDRWTDSAVFTADVAVSRTPGFATRRVRASLYGPDGDLVSTAEAPVEGRAAYDQIRHPTKGTARIRMNLTEIEKWTPEEPALYRVRFTLLDAEGNVLDTESCPVGFKRVDIEDGILKINGRRVIIQGVNRHEFAWRFGRAVPKEHMVREIEEMKRMNINAVRTCHYPDSPLWYDLCDEMGLLVLCECDLETHGVMGQISHDPNAAPIYTERAMRMVMQHKNHPCIYGWSLGNESGYGPGHAAMYGLIKEYDKTRLCQYESGDPPANISDTRGSMYASEKQILGMLADTTDHRPIILVEYLYQIRSAGGGMEKFIEMTQRYERFQGGFVWDWQDKSLVGKTADGVEFFAHGGDFGERYVDYECPVYMTNNGLVRADLAWKPAAYEVQQAYSPILFDRMPKDNPWLMAMEKQIFTVQNRTLGESSDAYSVVLTLQDEDGNALLRTQWHTEELAPGEIRRFDLEKELTACPQKPVFVLFEVTRRFTGEMVGRRQFKLSDTLCEVPAAGKGLCPAVFETEEGFTLTGKNYSCTVSKKTGVPVAYTRDGVTKILDGRLTTDRPYCGLDAIPGWGWRESMDKARALELKAVSSEALIGTSSVTVVTRLESDGVSCEVRVSCGGDGAVTLALDGQSSDGVILPRLGVELTLPEGCTWADYTGYGPIENYSDRLVSAVYGHYIAPVDDLGFDYAPPSENAGREGVRRLSLNGAFGSLEVRALKPFHFDARHCTVQDMKSAMHTHEIPRRAETTLHLDAWHMAIGGDMAWSTALDLHDVPHAALHTLRVVLK